MLLFVCNAKHIACFSTSRCFSHPTRALCALTNAQRALLSAWTASWMKQKINFSPLSTGVVFTPPAAIDCFHSLTSFLLSSFCCSLTLLQLSLAVVLSALHCCYLIHFFLYTFLASICPSHTPQLIRQHNNLKRLFNSSMAHRKSQVVSSEHCTAAGNI